MSDSPHPAGAPATPTGGPASGIKRRPTLTVHRGSVVGGSSGSASLPRDFALPPHTPTTPGGRTRASISGPSGAAARVAATTSRLSLSGAPTGGTSSPRSHSPGAGGITPRARRQTMAERSRTMDLTSVIASAQRAAATSTTAQPHGSPIGPSPRTSRPPVPEWNATTTTPTAASTAAARRKSISGVAARHSLAGELSTTPHHISRLSLGGRGDDDNVPTPRQASRSISSAVRNSLPPSLTRSRSTSSAGLLSPPPAQQQQYAHLHTPSNGVSGSDHAHPSPVPFDVHQFTKSHNGGERENISVVVRCRPFPNDPSVKRSVSLTNSAVTAIWKKEARTFTYDTVFNGDSTQQDVYNKCAGSMINQALQGFNATILAYGQTGSGKTHTMLGDLTEGSVHGGIVPSAVDHIFQYVAQASAPADGPDAVGDAFGQPQYLVSLSFLEIYNEHVHDLLSFTGSSVSLDVREDVATGAFHVPNLSQHIVTNRDELIALIQRGNTQRRTTATVMNEYSSRSHSMLTITIEKSYKRKPSPDGMVEESTMVVQSQINLVDLAGSERLTTSSKDSTGKETMAINLSLSTLANVIGALTSGEKVHVPYRDSKLTRLLKLSLGGNAKTLLIACFRGEESALPETISTLRYASRAKKIQNKAQINEDPKDALMRSLREEIAQLKEAVIEKNKMALRMFHLVNDLHCEVPDPDGRQEAASPTNDTMADITLETTTTTTTMSMMQMTAVTTMTSTVTTNASPTAESPASDEPESSPVVVTLTPDGGVAMQPFPPSPPKNNSADTTPTTPSPPSTPARRSFAARNSASGPSSPSRNSPKSNPATPPRASSATTAAASSPINLDFESSEKLLTDPFTHPQLAKILHSPSGSISLTYKQIRAMQAKQRGETISQDLSEAVSQTQFLAALSQNAPSVPAPTPAKELTAAAAAASPTTDDLDDAEVAAAGAVAPGTSSEALSELPQARFYSAFKANVLSLYTGLMACQTRLARKRTQHARAIERIGALEAAITRVRVAERADDAEEQAVIRPTTPTPTADASVDPPFSPMTPKEVLEEANRLKLESNRRSGGSARSSNADQRPAHSRRNSIIAIDQLLQMTPGENGSTSPSITGTSHLPQTPGRDRARELEETQRFLQLQASLEALRATLQQKEDEMAALRTAHEHERAEDASRSARALEHAQAEVLDQNRRLEGLETELERHRLAEENLGTIIDGHRAALAAAMGNGSLPSSRAHSPPPSQRSSLTPIMHDESSHVIDGGVGASPLLSPPSSEVPDLSRPSSLSSLDAKLTCLRTALAEVREQAALVPVLQASLQRHERSQADAEVAARHAAKEAELYRQLSEQEAVATRRADDLNHALQTQQLQSAQLQEEAIEKVRVEHAAALAQLRESHAAEIARLHEERAASLAELRQEHAVSVSQLREEHAATVTRLDDEHAASLVRLREEQEALLAERREEYAAALAQMHQDHTASLAQLGEEHATSLIRLREEHSAALEQQSARADQLQSRLTELEHERDLLVAAVEQLESAQAASAAAAAAAAPARSAISAEQTERWLRQTVELQNNILELTNEIQEIRNSKRELVKNSAQELKRMRFELLQLKGIPVPAEGGTAARQANGATTTADPVAATGSKLQEMQSCVLQ